MVEILLAISTVVIVLLMSILSYLSQMKHINRDTRDTWNAESRKDPVAPYRAVISRLIIVITKGSPGHRACHRRSPPAAPMRLAF